MAIAALIVWLATIGAGWSLLAIWLVEYDRAFHESAATRLPIPVMGAHALFALGGLAVWIGYLLAGTQRLAVTSAAILAVVAVLGFIDGDPLDRRVADAPSPVGGARRPARRGRHIDVPPERHLPVTLVIGHGVLAVVTVIWWCWPCCTLSRTG